MACPFEMHQVHGVSYKNAVISWSGGHSFLTASQCHGSYQLLLHLTGPLAQQAVDLTINLSKLSKHTCRHLSLCEETCPRVSSVLPHLCPNRQEAAAAARGIAVGCCQGDSAAPLRPTGTILGQGWQRPRRPQQAQKEPP